MNCRLATCTLNPGIQCTYTSRVCAVALTWKSTCLIRGAFDGWLAGQSGITLTIRNRICKHHMQLRVYSGNGVQMQFCLADYRLPSDGCHSLYSFSKSRGTIEDEIQLGI